MIASIALLAAAGVIVGCDQGSSFDISEAPLEVVEVRATTALDNDFQPIRTPLASDGTTPVLSTASIVVKFNRFLLPASIIRQSVCLTSDLTAPIHTADSCPNRIFIEPTYDPVRREVIFRQDASLGPAETLVSGTTYVLTVFVAADEPATPGVRAFDGQPLAQPVRYQFSTLAQDPPQAQPEVLPNGELYCTRDPECLAGCAADETCKKNCTRIGVASLLTETCGGGACHGSAMGLNLEDFANIQGTAVGKVAHQTQMGEHADEVDGNPRRFGRAMPIIDPTNPGNSYLLYKIVTGRTVLSDPPSAEELTRLRDAFVVGMPMPAPRQSESLFDINGADLISVWIAQGAPTRDCSLPPYN